MQDFLDALVSQQLKAISHLGINLDTGFESETWDF